MNSFLIIHYIRKNPWVTIIPNFVLVLYIFTFSKIYKMIRLYKIFFYSFIINKSNLIF